MHQRWLGVFAAAALLSTTAALAQESGRTDGPEGSEIGKGGYDKASSGKFSIGLDWGASFNTYGVLGATGTLAIPMYVGATASFWVSDWFLLDVNGNVALNGPIGSVWIGPRFRTVTWPMSASLGLRAGPMFTPGGAAFGLSPIVAVDMIFGRHFLLGLQGTIDVPLGYLPVVPDVRVGLNIGYRF